MYDELPNGIKDEKDLEIYEKFLKSTDTDSVSDFNSYLYNSKGKYIKAESLICGRIVTRCGILTDIGTDFIVLKAAQNNNCTAIRLSDIKYITLLNGRKKGCSQRTAF